MNVSIGKRGITVILCGALLACCLLSVRCWALTQRLSYLQEEVQSYEGLIAYQMRRRVDLQSDIFFRGYDYLKQEPAQVEEYRAYLLGVTECAVQEPLQGGYNLIFREDGKWRDMFKRFNAMNQLAYDRVQMLSEEQLQQLSAGYHALYEDRDGFCCLAGCIDASPADQERMEAFGRADRQLFEVERILEPGID